MTQHKQLGLIGLGRFGRFAARHLREHFEIVAADRRPIGDTAAQLGIASGSLQEAARCPVVVLAVPVQAIPETLERIAPEVTPGALVLDVASVKVRPMRWMRERLPEGVEILGTHPMFGPQSAAGGLAGHTIVVCPDRTTRTSSACGLLESLGLEVVVADADTHDRQAAYTQALAQYLGRAIRDLDGADYPIRTPAAAMLREVGRIVGDDTDELFEAIQAFNPYAAEMRTAVRRNLEAIDRRLATARGARA